MTHPPARRRLRRRLFPRLPAAVLCGLVASSAVALPATAADDTDPLRAPGVVVHGVAAPPTVLAKAWIVADAETGDVLAAKHAHLRLPPASTLKTLTAITLLPRLDLDEQYRVQWADAHVVGSAVGLVPGSRYTVDDLFYGLMLPSGNDAARALARAGGGVDKTVRAMNRLADRLGAHDTHAVNPTGLDAPGQLSSAFDLAVFARAGLTDRDFRRYVSTVSVPFPAQEPKGDARRKSYMIYNQNPLLVSGYRGVLGVKTGYTTDAGRTFVGAAERKGRTLVVALMDSVESSETAATKLLNWGFGSGRDATPVGSLDQPLVVLTSPQTLADDGATPQAAAVQSSATDEPVSSGGAGVAAWVLVGVVLTLAGWWLQRRRPAVPR